MKLYCKETGEEIKSFEILRRGYEDFDGPIVKVNGKELPSFLCYVDEKGKFVSEMCRSVVCVYSDGDCENANKYNFCRYISKERRYMVEVKNGCL